MRKVLDRATGGIPMYMLVLLCLTAITVVAVTLSLVGQLSRTPLDLLASLVVAVGATMLTGWAGALVVKRRWHVESSIITGLLIFMIMEPTTDPLPLAGIAITGAIATASKYLIAVRGRHIFNPAAVGTFVVGVVGIAFPAWWIGTPYLQPVIVIGALLVLYRTQRLALGATFAVTAGAVSVAAALIGGSTLESALGFAFLSSALFFFGGFMLSEPLTLPPRLWQQLAIAVVAALVFAVPFNSGIANKYLLALLAANLVAFAFGQRRGIRLRYLGKKQVGPATFELAFQPSRAVRYTPGQYMELTIPHRKADFRGTRRHFSISSAPGHENPITFAITVPTRSSSFKQALLDLQPGTIVHGTGVSGDFALPRDASQPLLLVAGGIGITPFASQLAHATAQGEQRDIVVAYATSSSEELPYRDTLERSGARVVLYSPEAPAELPAGWVYGGSGRVTGERLADAIPDLARRRVYVSGPPGLVTDLRTALRSQGVRRVHSDSFSGY
ncbi:oxidoreductase [Salinibacterium sp. G-O1]|uniref:FAD-dependent oxidoreductase n=1 Tax=Salinibacterium sp. G-O1 TaxID=3046208 RepID=UPI0024B99B44|nr:oxidoreductase [Salinibacterium sp. G-O1]MDJ0334243.1 oxidoreductase [Salinibacterium sp. G-O1]